MIGVIGAVALVAFVLVERRGRSPMLPLAIFHSAQFSATNVVTLFVYAGLAVSMFMLGLVLQEALGYSPIEAGAATLPLAAVPFIAGFAPGVVIGPAKLVDGFHSALVAAAVLVTIGGLV